MVSNILSMSLYGDSLTYLQGAIENARLMPSIYPDWKMVVYCEAAIDVSNLESLGCEIRRCFESYEHSGMFWRFLAAWDDEADFAIFRDADSRINVREAVAVRAWIASGRVAHCMHDNRHHCCMPIFGGMWGIKVGFLSIRLREDVIQKTSVIQKRVKDMRWLQRRVYPLIENDVLRHSSQCLKWPSEPFPAHPSFDGFVGQQYEC